MASRSQRNPLVAGGGGASVEMQQDQGGGGLPAPRPQAERRTHHTASELVPEWGVTPGVPTISEGVSSRRRVDKASAAIPLDSEVAQQHPLDLVDMYGLGVKFLVPQAWVLLCGPSGENRTHSRFLAAAAYVEDAIESRHADHGVDIANLASYRRAYSLSWQSFMIFLNLAHLCLAFLESPGSSITTARVEGSEGSRALHPYVETIELVILVFYAYDTYVQWVGHERKSIFYFRSGWRRAKIVLLVLTCLDVLVHVIVPEGRHGSLWSLRFLRAFWITEKVHTLRKTVNSIGKCIFDILRVLMIIALLIMLFAMLGFILFRDLPGNLQSATPNGFTTLGESVKTLFILLTTANFPNCMMFAYNVNPAFALFFVAYLCIGVYLMMNLVLGMMYHTYKNRTSDDNDLYRARSLVSLSKAFAYLDAENKGQIEVDTFRKLMDYLAPGLGNEEVGLLFEAVDYDNNGFISRGQFSHLVPFLKFRYKTKAFHNQEIRTAGPLSKARYWVKEKLEVSARDTLPALYKALDVCGKRVQKLVWSQPAPQHRRSNAYRNDDTNMADMIFDFFVLVNTALLIAQSALETCTVPELPCPPNKRTAPEGFESAHRVFLAIYCFELAIKIFGFGLREFWMRSMFNKMDAIIVGASVVGEIALNAGRDIAGFEAQKDASAIAFLRILRLLRVLRNIKRLQPIVHSILRVGKEIMSLFGVLFVLFYIYAVIGIGMFHDRMESSNPDFADKNLEYINQQFWGLNFDNIGRAYMTMFHILVVNNWWVTMEAAEAIFSPRGMATFFFISFIVIANILIINIMVAFLLERFVGTYQEEREKGGIFKLEEAIMDRIRDAFSGRVLVKRAGARLSELEVSMYSSSIIQNQGSLAMIRTQVSNVGRPSSGSIGRPASTRASGSM